MLMVSLSIRTGLRGGRDRVFLPDLLVKAFRLLVEAFCFLNNYLNPPHMRHDIEDMGANPTTGPIASTANDNLPYLISIEDIENESDDDESARIRHSRELERPEVEVQDLTRDRGPSYKVDTEITTKQAFLAAQIALERAKNVIIQFLATKGRKELADYVTVGSSAIMVSALDFLAKGDTGPRSLEDVYREYCSELRLKVRDSPKRTLLDDLDRVDEEMDSIIVTIKSQRNVLGTHRTYINGMFKLIGVIDSTIKVLENKLDVYEDLKVRVEWMRKQVSRQIELKQDNNNKAITIFTIVTVVFLPLSFVTSYLGMNTADIRNTDSGQWLFWTISVPVTLTIVGLAMGVAYQVKFKELMLRH
ncbi:hypothetical protein F4803DRAFT_165336 [Xylaria telfairii]|nr:hypothetical protein F4803DRAFT_165336 [Xylaria telfairii]